MLTKQQMVVVLQDRIDKFLNEEYPKNPNHPIVQMSFLAIALLGQDQAYLEEEEPLESVVYTHKELIDQAVELLKT